ncbi:MAG TPA: glycosyltransferase family 4 protein [Pyrinomonadaceae bacterium]|nr:glycosyltransferase family 4 protein [Pyrinomonadaceae bacterium]
MRIGLVIFADFPEGSGPPRRLHMLAKGLAQLGHEVHVVVPQRFRSGPLYDEFDGLHVHWGALTSPETWHRASERLKARRKALGLINRLASEGLDWLLLSNPSLDGLMLLLVARLRGARVIATYDDLRARRRNPTIEDRLRILWLETADALVPKLTQLNLATSALLERRVRSRAPSTEVLRFPPIVDPDLFQGEISNATEFRRKWGLEDTIVISYSGTFWHVEGINILLQAARQLTDSGERFKVVISGAPTDGMDCDDVSALVNEFNLQDVVVQTGWLTTSEVIAGMSAADILVVPKKNDIANRAGMPAKLAEYMAVGRAVVVSNIGDMPLYLTDGEDALLCEPGDPDSLAQALRRLLHDASLREKLATNARVAAAKHFDYRQVSASLESAMMRASEKK